MDQVDWRAHTGELRIAPLADADGDPGLTALRSATSEYLALKRELDEERAISIDLARRLDDAHAQAGLEEVRVSMLLASIRQLHHALYRGTTFEYILRASLDVTEAERGYYIAERGGDLKVQAALDVPATVGDVPSPFISGIVRQVLRTGEAVHWTADDPPDGVEPGPGEQFRAGVAVPVSTLGSVNGVIIALDKDGVFHDREVQSLLSVGSEAGVAVENAQLREEVQNAYVSTIALLADAVEAKDAYTRGHCEQVSQYARVAARRLGLSEDETRVACYTALLHDVGKIGVSDGVLNKPGPLMDEERKLVQAHARIGHDLLMGVPALREIASAVLYHHEWYDGNGYPEGLSGVDIPVASRIVAAIDAYCAMIDRRSYKEAFSAEHARGELARCAGTQFDPRVVDAVLEAIDEVDGDMQAGGGIIRQCGILPRPAFGFDPPLRH